ncbi:GNAT family N-acetyltransferase [Sporosarcina sp. Marseille-Q4943]|uniref:GNAT family N-acetyltransferase n=1 Tax=Sporosarcina sp. Marseille-Q4943 TaxID=2942204 RepID=UPI00208DD348|nr:GNAT family N-acetyltransferase [Sporosarcina sp. Marseille-Q4943]
MIIETNRLKLIACTPEFLAMIPPEDYEIRDHVKGHAAELQNDDSQLGWGVWFVVDKETDTIIGDIGFKGKPSTDHTVEIGYGIVPSAQNKGYATEAVGTLIEWAFASREVEIVIAECVEENSASIKVLEKLGFRKTGRVDNMLKWEM